MSLCARGPGDNITENTWCIDSGATNHMVNDRRFFKQLTTYNDVVSTADGNRMKIIGMGSGDIKSQES